MALKLTVLLAAAIFVAMYFAPPSPEIDPARAQSTQSAPAPVIANPAPQTPAPAAPEAPPQTATAPQIDRDAVSAALDEAQTDAGADPGQSEAAANLLNGLGAGSLALSGSASDALSLADSVRARTETTAPARQVPEQLDLSQPVETLNVPANDADTRPETPALPVSIVTATSVNLRAGPSTAESVVGRVSQGDRVEVIGTSASGWTGIRHPERGDTVYISSQFLEPTQ